MDCRGRAWAYYASPPRRDKGEEMLVRPWSGVICNIQGTRRKGVIDGPGGLEILEFFRVFNPENVQIMRNNKGHMGMAIVQFRNDPEGFKDAVAFEKYFLERKRVREHWMANKGEEVRGPLYGWLARGEDYHDTTFSRYLQATGELVPLHNVTEEMEVAACKNQVEQLTSKLEETTTRCTGYEDACRSTGEQLLACQREVDKWMRNAEKLVRLGQQSDKKTAAAETKAAKYLQDLQNARQLYETQRQGIEVAKECIVCYTEFGAEIGTQRSHYTECHHANVCYTCASRLWRSNKRRCPSCNTPAKQMPGQLPAKIFL